MKSHQSIFVSIVVIRMKRRMQIVIIKATLSRQEIEDEPTGTGITPERQEGRESAKWRPDPRSASKAEPKRGGCYL
jgi:hypothetical protein